MTFLTPSSRTEGDEQGARVTSTHEQNVSSNSDVGDVDVSVQASCTGDPGLCKKATINQVTTMLATSKNVIFPGHNHLLTTSTDDPSL